MNYVFRSILIVRKGLVSDWLGAGGDTGGESHLGAGRGCQDSPARSELNVQKEIPVHCLGEG